MKQLPLTQTNTENIQQAGTRSSIASEDKLTSETLNALEELGMILKSIHRRIIVEGFEVTDGEVRFKEHQ